MKTFGSSLLAMAVLTLLLFSRYAAADITAVVDRTQVALGDSFRLILTATDGETLTDVNLAVLERDFAILQKSSTNQTSIVNGRRSHTRQLQIDLAPRVEGNLQIPGLRVGSTVTDPIAISVTAAPEIASGDQPLLFEAEVDRDQVYVQGQVILTLRVMQAINLEGSNITQLELDNAYVKTLEQKSFQRTIDGRPWLVHEVRYAIFPEQSGTLEIPAQVFSGREAVSRRSLFDLGSNGKRLRRVTQPLSIEVLPRPRQFPDGEWLPARNLTITEEWSAPPEQLRVGESSTRTLRITGEGLQGAQLPPVRFTPVDGVKFYPDQPHIAESEVATGLLGTRQDSAALVPTRAGELTLPEIRIPWWDTDNETVRYAVLPARTVTIAPGAAATAPAPVAPATVTTDAAATPAPAPQGSTLPWQILSGFSSLGWLLTIGYLLWQRKREHPAAATTGSTGSQRERHTFRALQRACTENDPSAARTALIQWACTASGDRTLTSLEQVCAHFGDAALDSAVATLDSALYSGTAQADAWTGTALETAVTALRANAHTKAGDNASLTLYPGGA